MDYIVWKKPNGDVAITYMFIEHPNVKTYAGLLKQRGDIPDEYTFLGTNLPIPEGKFLLEELEIDSVKKEIKVKKEAVDKRNLKP